MKYELRENQGIPAPLLALLAVATGLSVANCYYNQPLLGSMAKDFGVSDFSASMVAKHGKGFWGKRLFCQHGCDIDPDRLCSRTCVCHSAWRFGFTKAADIDQLYHFIVRIACHSTCP